jgi:hypothetical protein
MRKTTEQTKKKSRPPRRKKPVRVQRRRPVALITGASSGIGNELAKIFAAKGFDLVVVARRRAPLESLAAELESAHGTRVIVLPEDLLDAAAPKRIHTVLKRRGIAVEVLVNNAGVVVVDHFVNNSAAAQLDLIRLNVLALTALTRFFVPDMVARGSGRVLNVASAAAFQPTPSLAVYGASKAFVLSLSESLAVELEGTGVTVTALCPGFTETPLLEKAEKRLHKPGLVPGLVPSLFMLDAAAVAEEGYEACMAGTPVCINGLSYEMMISWEKLQPRWLVRLLGSVLSRRFRDAPTAPGRS